MSLSTDLAKTIFIFFLAVFVYSTLLSCSSKSNNGAEPKSVKLRQYYLQGEVLYVAHCSNCHQRDGTGLRRIIPPLNKSDFMRDNLEEVICMIRNGKKEPIVVNGDTFVQPMPDNPKLTDLEIAEIATYIYNTWEHQHGIIEVKQVSTILHNCNKSF